jgi:hypothetical protein
MGTATRSLQVPLTGQQRSALELRARPGRIVGQAALVALAVPLVIAYAILSITRVAARIPLVGWLLVVYGLTLAVFSSVAAVLAIPIVFACAVPTLLLTRRSKLRADLAGGIAVQRTGTFPVTDRKAGGTITCGEDKLRLSSKEMAQLRPALQQQPGGGKSLVGAVSYGEHSRAVLEIRDSGGAAVLGVE